MAGQRTPIVSNDFNNLQGRISRVLGIGDGDYGYGQQVSSISTIPKTTISASQWNELRTDILKSRQHQTGLDESSSLNLVVAKTEISNAIYDAFSSLLTIVETDRLVTPPSTQATRENLAVGTRTTPWNAVVTHTVTTEFDTEDSLRCFFNAGGAIEISASRTGGIASIKNNTWSTLLTNMGTIKFTRSQTTSTGSGTGSQIGYDGLTQVNQLVFQKLAGNGSYYSLNEYNIYARLGVIESEIVFTIEFNDVFDDSVGDNIDGTLTSTVQIYRSSGSNVSNRRPSVASEMDGGTVVVTPVDPPVNVTYLITPNTVTIGEASTAVIFTITTTNVPDNTTLYWTTNGGLQLLANDFVDNIMSGSVVINNNTASVIRAAKEDSLTEGLESFFLELRTTSIAGPVVATSSVIAIQDLSVSPTPLPATYAISSVASIMAEGGVNVTFNIVTTNIPNGTVLYWTTVGSAGISSADFVDSTTTGSFVINNNTGTINRIARADNYTEGLEYFNIELRSISISGPVLAVSNNVSIIDASLTPALSLSVLPTVIDEGATLTITLNASNIESGRTLYLTYTGTISDQDLLIQNGPSVNVTTREFTYTTSPTVWTYQILADQLTEGTETGTWQIRENSKTGTVLATSSTVTIGDSSQTITPAYSIVNSTNVTNEGTSVNFTFITTTADGTYEWENIGTSTASDFTDNINLGTFTVASGTGVIQRIVKADKTTENLESIIIQVKKDGVPVVTSTPVTINDTSITPAYSIISSASLVDENSAAFTFTFTTTDANGTYYWENIGTSTAADFVDNLNSGSFVVTSGVGTIQRSARADLITESNETVILRIRATESGEVLATSNAVTINDTSRTPPGSISYAAGQHAFTVPANVYALRFNVSGAGGGNGGQDASNIPGQGSTGSRVTGEMAVIPGTVVMVYVGSAGQTGATGASAIGGAGGYSYGIGYDGGRGGSSGWKGTSGAGGGGGAASVLQYNGVIRVVAGGGGGGGGSGQYGAGSPGIYSPPGGLPYSGSGSAGKNCGWADGGGGGAGGGGRGAGAGASVDPPAYDTGGRGGQAGGSWFDGELVADGSYSIGSLKGSPGTVSFSWGG
jgi:hypothetical protein